MARLDELAKAGKVRRADLEAVLEAVGRVGGVHEVEGHGGAVLVVRVRGGAVRVVEEQSCKRLYEGGEMDLAGGGCESGIAAPGLPSESPTPLSPEYPARLVRRLVVVRGAGQPRPRLGGYPSRRSSIILASRRLLSCIIVLLWGK